MKSPVALVLLIAVIFGIGIALVSGNPFSRSGSKGEERHLPSPEKSTKTISLSPQDVVDIKNIPSKTVIKLNQEKTLEFEGKTYYMIGENVGTSILTSLPKSEGGWDTLVPSGYSHPDYREIYKPAQPCPLYAGNKTPTLDTCANHLGVTLEGHLYALKQTVNQAINPNDKIHTYNIFDVYYEKAELSRAAEKESEHPILNNKSDGGIVIRDGHIGVEVELDETVSPPVLRVTGYFMGIKLPSEIAEKEFSLQGKNIPTLSEAVDELTYLGKLSDLSSTVFDGDKSNLHAYHKEPYVYVSDSDPDEIKAQTDKDQDDISGSDYGDHHGDDKDSLQLKPFIPARPTILFDVYILSDLSVLRPSVGYIRPMITTLHVGVPECPALYLYGQNGHRFSVDLPSNTYNTIPYTASNSWSGEIVPGGLQVGSSVHDYLFYTTTPNYSPKPPAEGWVISSNEFSRLQSEFLPSIGLTNSESKDASDYLQGVLPVSDYYLVSPKLDINSNPIKISPKPDTFLYYTFFVKPLDDPISVQKPIIEKPARNGTSAVMWGEKILAK